MLKVGTLVKIKSKSVGYPFYFNKFMKERFYPIDEAFSKEDGLKELRHFEVPFVEAKVNCSIYSVDGNFFLETDLIEKDKRLEFDFGEE